MVEGDILGIGLDVVETGRIRDLMERWGARFTTRVFTRGERTYCDAKAVPWRHYAGRWAVKEAVSKALGTGITPAVAWLDIEVVNDSSSGAPAVKMSERGAQFIHAAGIANILVSLSHTERYAAAQAIVTGQGRGRRGAIA